MTEYAEDFEDEYLYEDEFEEFEDEDERTYAINSEIADFERQTGVELSDDEWQHMGTQIELYGVTPEEAYGRTDAGRDDEAFAELVQRISIVEGRDLTDTELERLAMLDQQAELQGIDQIDATQALHDLDTADGRAALISERLEIPPEREQPSANVVDPETGEAKPGFNLDDGDQQAAAIDALMAGEDVAVYDSTYERIEGD